MADEAETQRLLGTVTGELRGLKDLVAATFNELTRQLADTNKQAHEIKHAQGNQSMALAGINEKFNGHVEILRAHIESDDNTNRVTIEFRRAQSDELIRYRIEMAASIQEIKDSQSANGEKLDDLILWRGKLLGGVTVVGVALSMLGVILGIFGRFIFDQAMLAWHTIRP